MAAIQDPDPEVRWLPQVMLAGTQKALAFKARGGGYGNTVADERWIEFKRQLANAEELLLAVPPEGQGLSWLAMAQEFAVAGSWSDPAPHALLEVAAARAPGYHQPFFNEAHRLRPRWHGSLEELLAFAANQSARMSASEGPDALYARICWSYRSDWPEGERFGTKANLWDWNRVRLGCEQLLERYPDSQWNRQNFIRMALEAGDLKTGHAWMLGVTERHPRVWPSLAEYEQARGQLGAGAEAPRVAIIHAAESAAWSVSDEVEAAAFSAKADLAVVAQADAQLCWLSVPAGRQLETRRLDESVKRIAISRDGAVVLTATGEALGTVQSWRRGGREALEHFTPENPLRALVLSADGKHALALGGADSGQAWRWPLAAPESETGGPDGAATELPEARMHPHRIRAGALSANGGTLALPLKHGVAFWSATGKRLDTPTEDESAAISGWLERLVWSGDQTRLVGLSLEWTELRVTHAHLWRWRRGVWKLEALSAPLDVAEDPVLAVDAAGRRALVGAKNGRIQLVDMETDRVVAEAIGHETGIVALAFAADGRSFHSLDRRGGYKRWLWPAR